MISQSLYRFDEDLTASVTTLGHLERTFHWTIDKTVAPKTINMFVGDSQDATYTISVTKDSGTDIAYFEGQVCVTNGGAVATQNLAINVNLTKPPSNDVIATAVVDVSQRPVLAPGETFCYDYRVDVPAGSITPGATYKVTADVTITNHSGHLGTPFGPSPSTTGALPETPTLINDTINVNDTNGSSFTFSAGGSKTYTKSFCCSQPSIASTPCQSSSTQTYNNTATIEETGQFATASVTVNCFALTVSKDVITTFTRNFCWTIDKQAVHPSNQTLQITNLILSLGQSFDVLYKVNVTSSATDSNWVASGTIIVNNPAPISALVSITDLITPGNIAVPIATNITLDPSSQQSFSFSIPLPDGTSRTNQARVTLQNTPSGTTNFFSNLVPFEFNQPTNFTNQCVNVEDSFGGTLGTLCEVGQQFSYTRRIGPFDTCGDRVIANTASFTTTDIPTPPETCATGKASWNINVSVPCFGGCTHTIGFWKTHAGFGPQNDLVTPLLPIILGNEDGPQSITVSTAAQAVSILGFEGSNGIFDAANGINKLYAQLLAAQLNINDGANGSAIASTLVDVNNFLSINDSTSWAGLTKAQKQQVLSWAKILENYNTGLIGPGHCSE
ncbi:MAG: hypothetical protein H6Q68_2452 [Firmicutes bacterium]|nr:hypothetical protein [Bacillota bacterium]